MNIKIPNKYFKIWEKAIPYLKRCRKGELEHSQRIAEGIYRLSKEKEIDLDFLIPVAILHDTGHAAVLPEHFKFVTGPDKEENSKLVHMLTGAKIAHDILVKVKYSAKKIEQIVDFIRIHDKTDKNLFKTNEEKIFHDFDRLDRLDEIGLKSLQDEFGLTIKKTLELIETHVIKGIILPEFLEKAEVDLKKLKEKYL